MKRISGEMHAMLSRDRQTDSIMISVGLCVLIPAAVEGPSEIMRHYGRELHEGAVFTVAEVWAGQLVFLLFITSRVCHFQTCTWEKTVHSVHSYSQHHFYIAL